MNQPTTSAAPATLAHSEEYFGDYRDFWWNADFLELMARRWQLKQYRTLLDVGCGQCHWSRLLLPHLDSHPEITGLDRDPKWAAGDVKLCDEFAAKGATLNFRQGDAQQLPFANDSFDVVTCQTVLIHLADPLAALREMHRVVRPGGMVICSEPSNLANAGMAEAPDDLSSSAERVADYRYRLLCEIGKRLSGEGDSSLGDRLAYLFQQAGFEAVQSHLSDKAAPSLPPYLGLEQAANLDELLDGMSAARCAVWDEHVRRWSAYLDAADAAFVAGYSAQRAERYKRTRSLVDAGRYWSGGATVMYLISARK
ncbi:class I SAM-dependent methyltransferase [Chitinimonas arctica]|uniref:Class I SAM-dependent methyltransferase n=1 Tax=Chitinimonas arctica TaxID=2594795 RepID=A0A516SDC6_9NEIS|nr:class I SAM-dependent methyltransferase [Chitinimonas arctica]QDQ26149.1 class I SAM-dependent methyltransferase [Chitinimonas arctica]